MATYTGFTTTTSAVFCQKNAGFVCILCLNYDNVARI